MNNSWEVPRTESVQKVERKENDGMTDSKDGDENVERGNWSGKLDFILSSIGYAVGLGNVWRFPYKAYDNGGGSFLIPYAIMLATAGLPLFFMEMSIGQFSSEGPITVWKCMPFFKGIGYAMVIISGLVCIYYNMIIAYTLYYLFASLTSELPWQRCFDHWPAEWGCKMRNINETMWNQTAEWCHEMKDNNRTEEQDFISNCTAVFKPRTPSQVYWERVVLDQSEGIDVGQDELKWELVLCLVLSWVIVFFCLIKGIKSSGKVVYVTATFPYIVLIILLIRNVTLEGAKVGILFYITPEWEKLKDAKVWHAAAVQIFYSLGVAFGGLETMASYNKFKNNVHRDSVLVAIINCVTSVIAGFVIFSVIGHMSVMNNVEISKVADAGPGLAFIAYPEGISLMPVPQLWSVLFFIMLLTLGLDTQFTMMETVLSAIADMFPILRKTLYKILFTLGVCIVFFLLGLPQCSRGGIYVMNLFDWYCASFALIIVSIFEIVAIAYIYNFFRFMEDIQMMLGKKPHHFWIYWLATWLVVTPAMLVFILVFNGLSHSPVKHNDYVYPEWADGIGWLMVGAALLPIPLLAIIELILIYLKGNTFVHSLWKLFQPTDTWGPAVERYRTGRYSQSFSDIKGIGEVKYTAYPTSGVYDNPAFPHENSNKF